MTRFSVPSKPQIIASVCCLLIFTAEVLATEEFTRLELACAILYAVLLVGMAISRIAAPCAMMILALFITLTPQMVYGPSVLWGTWVAIAFLSMRTSPIVSIVLTSSLTIATFVYQILQHEPITVGVVCMSATYPFALLIGLLVRKQHEIDLLKVSIAVAQEKAKQQQRNSALVRLLHDSVASSMTYALLLCRQEQRCLETHNVEKSAKLLQQLDQTLLRTLREIRTGAIRSLMDASSQTGVQYAGDSISALHDSQRHRLFRIVDEAQQRLESLGFTGSITVDDVYLLPAKYIPPTCDIVQEMANNILKHGKPGPFLIRLSFNNTMLRIISSNIAGNDGMKPHSIDRATENMRYGYSLIKQTVETLSGTVAVNDEDDEWTVVVSIPVPDDMSPITA